MKKLFFMAFLIFTITASLTSCTEENVKPKQETDGGGGGGIDPKSH